MPLMRATHVVIGNVKKKRIKEILHEFTTKPKFFFLFFTVNFKGKREVTVTLLPDFRQFYFMIAQRAKMS